MRILPVIAIADCAVVFLVFFFSSEFVFILPKSRHTLRRKNQDFAKCPLYFREFTNNVKMIFVHCTICTIVQLYSTHCTSFLKCLVFYQFFYKSNFLYEFLRKKYACIYPYNIRRKCTSNSARYHLHV